MTIFAVPLLMLFMAFMVVLGSFLGAAFGAFVGWVISVIPFLNDFVLNGFRLLGVNMSPNELVYIGAALGFIGGFFRTTTSTKG